MCLGRMRRQAVHLGRVGRSGIPGTFRSPFQIGGAAGSIRNGINHGSNKKGYPGEPGNDDLFNLVRSLFTRLFWESVARFFALIDVSWEGREKESKRWGSER